MALVLVVDDSPVDRKLASKLLADAELQVVAADGGDSALSILRETDVDLIVTDLIMAPMNGLGLIQQVVQRYPQVPVVIMTSLGNDTLAVQALQSGAASYVAKRRLAQDLKETVRHVLSLNSAASPEVDLRSLITRTSTRYVLDNDLDQIQTLISHLQEAVSQVRLSSKIKRMTSISFTQAEQLRINMALYEAMLNACRHGNLEIDPSLDTEAAMQAAQQKRLQAPFRHRNIIVDVTLTPTEATYVVGDEGSGFDVAAHVLDENDSLDERPGRGIALMQNIMDELKYNDAGNQVTLVKWREPDSER